MGRKLEGLPAELEGIPLGVKGWEGFREVGVDSRAALAAYLDMCASGDRDLPAGVGSKRVAQLRRWLSAGHDNGSELEEGPEEAPAFGVADGEVEVETAEASDIMAPAHPLEEVTATDVVMVSDELAVEVTADGKVRDTAPVKGQVSQPPSPAEAGKAFARLARCDEELLRLHAEIQGSVNAETGAVDLPFDFWEELEALELKSVDLATQACEAVYTMEEWRDHWKRHKALAEQMRKAYARAGGLLRGAVRRHLAKGGTRELGVFRPSLVKLKPHIECVDPSRVPQSFLDDPTLFQVIHIPINEGILARFSEHGPFPGVSLRALEAKTVRMPRPKKQEVVKR